MNQLKYYHFRFEDLQIWQKAIQINFKHFEIAEQLDKRKYYKLAEQLRSASLSISNNIAEGSGSKSDKEFIRFLSYSKRSVFECANIIFLISMNGIIADYDKIAYLIELDELSRMTQNMMKYLNTK